MHDQRLMMKPLSEPANTLDAPPMAAAPVDVPLPRSFKLLEEYDCAIGKKGKTLLKGQHANFIQYGLADDGDMDLATWRATIIGPQGKQIGEFIYMLELVCGPDYPQTPPRVKFQAPRLAMPAVGQDGSVRAIDPRWLAFFLVHWSDYSPPFDRGHCRRSRWIGSNRASCGARPWTLPMRCVPSATI